MSRYLLSFVIAGAIAAPVFAQHGHGNGAGGAMGAHGAPPVFTAPAPAASAKGTMPASTTPAASSPRASAGGTAHTTATTTIANNPALATRVQTLLPAGTNVQTAAAGFRNTGQFLAAVHVSHNLNIPFTQLKASMTGTNPESLGRAIHDLRPNLTHSQIRAAERTAARETDRDIAANRLSTLVTSNSQLAQRVRSLLPSGMSLQTAVTGFRNQGQFLAALHAAHNLGIPFAQLKARMTGDNPESLGRAIHDLRPTLSHDTIEADVDLARDEAKADVKRS